MKDNRLAAHAQKLLERFVVSAGLSDLSTVEHGDLIGADHQGAALTLGDDLGLFTRQADRCIYRRLTRSRRFVDFRRIDVERYLEPREQVASIGRAGSENDAGTQTVVLAVLRENGTHRTDYFTRVHAMQPINIAEFCSRSQTLEGTLADDDIARVADEVSEFDPLSFRVEGLPDARSVDLRYAGRPALLLSVHGRLEAPCLRCLAPVDIELNIDDAFVFFDTEQHADLASMEDENLNAAVFDRSFDVAGLIEDEILLALEDRARHSTCPSHALEALGLTQSGDRIARLDDEPKPFDSLAVLKKS